MKEVNNKMTISYRHGHCVKTMLRNLDLEDRATFARFTELYYPRLMSMAGTILKSNLDCEEVVQDALLRACRSMKKFRGESKLTTWLCRIVINQAKNRYRAIKKEKKRLKFCDLIKKYDLMDESSANQQEILLIADMSYAEYTEILLYNISLLPRKVREALKLRYINNFSYEMIAEELQCSIGTVKSRISRGQKQLLVLLREFDWQN